MTDRTVLRVGAAAALVSAVAQVVSIVLLPDEGHGVDDAIRAVAGSGPWTAGRLIGSAGALGAVVALTVVARTFTRAYLAVGLYLLTLARAIFAGDVYSRRLGRASATSGALVVVGILAERAWYNAWVPVAIGHLLFTAVLIAIGVNLWRQSRQPLSAVVAEEPRSASPADHATVG